MNRLFAGTLLLLLGACQSNHKGGETVLTDTIAAKKADTVALVERETYKQPGTWDASVAASKKGAKAKLSVKGNVALMDKGAKLTKGKQAAKDSVLVLKLSAEPDKKGAKAQTVTYNETLPNARQYKQVKIMYQDRMIRSMPVKQLQ